MRDLPCGSFGFCAKAVMTTTSRMVNNCSPGRINPVSNGGLRFDVISIVFLMRFPLHCLALGSTALRADVCAHIPDVAEWIGHTGSAIAVSLIVRLGD